MLVALAAISLLALVLTLGRLTEPEPELISQRTETPSTVSSTSQLDWQHVTTVEDTVPYAVMEHGNQILLFTSTPPSQAARPTGLQVWRSDDGLAWEPEGTAISQGNNIESITSTALGLIVIGSVGEDETVRAWLSADGVNWLTLMEGLPVDARGFESFGQTSNTDEESLAMADMGSAIGSDASVIKFEVVDGRGIALVSRLPDLSRPFDLDTFEIWTASLK